MALFACKVGGSEGQQGIIGVVIKSCKLNRGTTGSNPATYNFVLHSSDESADTLVITTSSTMSNVTAVSNCVKVSNTQFTVTDPTLDFEIKFNMSGEFTGSFSIS